MNICSIHTGKLLESSKRGCSEMNVCPIGYMLSEARQQVEEYKQIGERNGKIIAAGYLQTDLNDENRNGRIYGTPGIKKEVEGARIKELIETGNLKGEDGHPTDQSMAVQQSINPKVTCVKYLKVEMQGDNVYSEFCGTNTIYGKAFNEDLQDGELPSFSLRAIGTVNNIAGKCHVDNVHIVTWDRVYYPSHRRAYTKKIISEGAAIWLPEDRDMVMENSIITPITNQSLTNFIKEESSNLKFVKENFDTLFESMTVMNNGRNVQILTKNGDTLVITLESYVQNQIMDYCDRY